MLGKTNSQELSFTCYLLIFITYPRSFGPLFNSSITEENRIAAIAKVGTKLDYLNGVLKGRKYLVGESFTVADSYLYIVLSWTGYVKVHYIHT